MGLRVEESFNTVRKMHEEMTRLKDDNQEFRVDLNKSIKLHEVVIENKFKDIRM